MNIVAIHKIPDNKDGAAAILSEITGTTRYEAGSRLSVAGRFPVVVAAYSEFPPAEETAAKLRSGGFGAIVLKQDEIKSEKEHFIVRKFFLDDRELRVESRQEKSLVVDYCSIDLILRGTCIQQTTKTVTEKGKKFSISRAVISGGLIMTKSTEKSHVNISENREMFLHLYTGSGYIIVFRENSLVYLSLGSMLKPARSANFAFINAELKRRCSASNYNESLLNRAVQAQILGPLFNPEEHLDIAISFMAKSLRQKR